MAFYGLRHEFLFIFFCCSKCIRIFQKIHTYSPAQKSITMSRFHRPKSRRIQHELVSLFVFYLYFLLVHACKNLFCCALSSFLQHFLHLGSLFCLLSLFFPSKFSLPFYNICFYSINFSLEMKETEGGEINAK